MTKRSSELDNEIEDALARLRMRGAVVVGHEPGKNRRFSGAALETGLAELGYPKIGETPVGGRLRPELQGAPKFHGLSGPMWSGEEAFPLRYETFAALREISK
jgi:hypothetical protein